MRFKNAFTLNLLHRRSSSLWPQEGTEDSLKMLLLQFDGLAHRLSGLPFTTGLNAAVE